MPAPKDPEAAKRWKAQSAERMREVQAMGQEAIKQKKARRHDFVVESLMQSANPIVKLVGKLTDKYMLTDKQQAFLLWRVQYRTDVQCATFIGINPTTLNDWKRNKGRLGRFREAYEEWQQEIPTVAAEQMQSLMWKGVTRTDEMLDATRVTRGQDGKVLTEEPDWTARGKAIEIISRWNGKGWNESANTDADPRYLNTMNRFMDIIEKSKQENVIEGEVRVIESPDESA